MEEKYVLTPSDIEGGKNAFIMKAFQSAKPSAKPSLALIVAGPGAGKTGIEWYVKRKFAEKGKSAISFGSDILATFHPYYEVMKDTETSEDVYKYTRQFTRPATLPVLQALAQRHFNVFYENTLDKGDVDIEQAQIFRDAGYRIRCNIMATDEFEARMSVYERDARSLEMGETPRGCSINTQKRMYNGFIPGVYSLLEHGLLDDIMVFTRGERIDNPNVVYQMSSEMKQPYANFEEALHKEREKQRIALLKNPIPFYERIERARATITRRGINPALTQDELDGLQLLQDDFDAERAKYAEKTRGKRKPGGYSFDD